MYKYTLNRGQGGGGAPPAGVAAKRGRGRPKGSRNAPQAPAPPAAPPAAPMGAPERRARGG